MPQLRRPAPATPRRRKPVPAAVLVAGLVTLPVAGAAPIGAATQAAAVAAPSSVGAQRPASGPRVACAVEAPVCVHAPTEVGDDTLQQALAAARRAVAALPLLGLPSLPPDVERGGGPAFDLYLRPDQRGGAAFADPRIGSGPVDQATAFALVGAAPAGSPCALASRVTRAVIQGTLVGFDPAMHDGTLAMYCTHLASLLAPCPALEAAAVDRYQRQPERALLGQARNQPSGAMLLSAFVDERFGAERPGAVMGGIIAASAQGSEPAADGWQNEPDIFDTLRRILPPQGLQLGDLLIDFAVARAFVGSRADGKHLVDVERYGALGRVRFEWSVSISELPKRVAPLRAIQSTGSTYLWLSLDGAKPRDRIVLAAEWEQSFVFEWAAVQVDAAGREVGRLTAGGVFGNDRAELTVADVSHAAALLIVGTNVGYDDRGHPYDPDEPPREASYELTLYRQ